MALTGAFCPWMGVAAGPCAINTEVIASNITNDEVRPFIGILSLCENCCSSHDHALEKPNADLLTDLLKLFAFWLLERGGQHSADEVRHRRCLYSRLCLIYRKRPQPIRRGQRSLS